MEDARQQLWRHAARQQVAVQRIDEGIALGIVAKADLAGGRSHTCPACEQRWQLVAHLLTHRAEAPGQHVLQVGLQDELVVLHTVQAQLLGQDFAHLPGRA